MKANTYETPSMDFCHFLSADFLMNSGELDLDIGSLLGSSDDDTDSK